MKAAALVGIVLVAVALRVASLSYVRQVDDAYISYRYAEMLAAGEGFVYNPGEPVLGTTTPLYTMLLSCAALFGASAPSASLAFNALFDLGSLLLLFFLGRRWFDDRVGILLAASWGFAWVGVSSVGYGMESQLFILLMIASLCLLERENWKSLGLVLGAAVLTRPEGAIVALLVGASLLRQRRSLLQVILAAVIPVAIWVVFATLYFGSPLPQSVAAKLSQSHSSLREGIDFFFARNPILPVLWVLHFIALVTALRRSRPAEFVLLVSPVALVSFYLITRPVFLGAWYFPAVAVGLCCGAILGMREVASRISLVPGRAVVPFLLLAWFGLAAVAIPRSWRSAAGFRQAIERVYLPLSEFVAEQSHPTDRVLASDIGYLGYYSGRHIFDAAGLVSPEVVQAGSGARADGLPRDVGIALDLRPEFVVLPVKDGIYERFMASRFEEFYDPVARFQQDGQTELVLAADPSEVYARRGHFVADFIVFRRVGGIR